MELTSILARDILRSLLIIAAIALWIRWLWGRRHWYRFSLKFPGVWGAPIIGMFSKCNENDVLKYLDKLTTQIPTKTFCVWMGLYPVVLSADPVFIEKVLSSPDLLNKSENVYKPSYKLFQGGIIASPAKEWTHNRKMINPSFQHKVLLSFFPAFNRARGSVMKQLATLTDGREHKLSDLLTRTSIRLSVETTMGKVMEDGDKLDKQFAESIHYLEKCTLLSASLSFINLGFIVFWDRKYQKIRAWMHKFIEEIIVAKISKPIESEHTTISEDVGIQKKSSNILIDQAIEIYQRKQFTWQDVISECNTMVLASFETTANAILSTLVMLAMHTDVQERLHDEILNAFPQKMPDIEFEDLGQLPYLEMVINETLRVTPPVPLIGRQVVKDTQLQQDLILPQGLCIYTSIFHLQRRKDIWGPNADKFNPDNFLPANLTGKHSHAFMPFSKGIRNCIGWRYALFSMKVMIIGLIRNYRFETSSKFEDLEFKVGATLQYIKEPMFTIHHR